MPICSKDCFACPFPDCINDAMDGEDLQESVRRDRQLCSKGGKSAKATYYERNREKVLAKAHAYYAVNREEISARKQAYYIANRDERKAHAKAYYHANREQILAKQRQAYAARREARLCKP